MHARAASSAHFDWPVPLSHLTTSLCSALVCFADLSSVLGRYCVFAGAAHPGEQEVSVRARKWPDVCV